MCYDFSILTYDRFNCPDTSSYNDLVCALSNQNFADFNSTVLQNCEPLQFSFDALGENIESVIWAFGDGTSGNGMNVTHDFMPLFNLSLGLQITMTATDTTGCQTSSTFHCNQIQRAQVKGINPYCRENRPLHHSNTLFSLGSGICSNVFSSD